MARGKVRSFVRSFVRLFGVVRSGPSRRCESLEKSSREETNERRTQTKRSFSLSLSFANSSRARGFSLGEWTRRLRTRREDALGRQSHSPERCGARTDHDHVLPRKVDAEDRTQEPALFQQEARSVALVRLHSPDTRVAGGFPVFALIEQPPQALVKRKKIFSGKVRLGMIYFVGAPSRWRARAPAAALPRSRSGSPRSPLVPGAATPDSDLSGI